MLKWILFFTMLLGASAFLSGEQAFAQFCTGGGDANFTCTNESTIKGSASLGFNPTANLMPAVTNADPSLGPCFTCPNTNVSGTTAGALTNSMFGEIRENNNADIGDETYSPAHQGMTIPSVSECGSDCNDAGVFTYSTPFPTQDFLSAGTQTQTNPSTGVVVGQAGTRIRSNIDFFYNADGSTSFFQSVSQTTFVEGLPGDELQIITLSANGVSAVNTTVDQYSGTINWEQSIQQGGFNLGLLNGVFSYENPSYGDAASAPTGASQSNGMDAIIVIKCDDC